MILKLIAKREAVKVQTEFIRLSIGSMMMSIRIP
jgi:hypothetical protein